MSRGYGSTQRAVLALLREARAPLPTASIISAVADANVTFSWDGTVTTDAPPSVCNSVRRALLTLRRDRAVAYRLDEAGNRNWAEAHRVARPDAPTTERLK